MKLKEYLLEKRAIVDRALENYLPEMTGPKEELYKAEINMSISGRDSLHFVLLSVILLIVPMFIFPVRFGLELGFGGHCVDGFDATI